MNKRITLAATLLLSISANSQAVDLLTALNDAEQSDPQLRAARAQMKATSEGKKQAFASFLPQISATASKSQGSRDQSIEGNSLGELPDSDTEFWQVQLNQTLFRKDIWTRHSQARVEATKASVDYDIAYQNFLQNVAKSYFDVLTAQDSLRFAKAEEKAIGRQLEQAEQRFEVGLTAITDVHEAKASFDGSRARVILAKNRVDDAFEALHELTGTYYSSLSPLTSNLDLGLPQPADPKAWVELALANSPDLGSQKLNAKISEYNIDMANSAHYPSLNFSASRSGTLSGNQFFNDSQGNLGGPFDFQTFGTTYSISMNVPIYSGGSTSSKARQARYGFEAAQEFLDQTRRKVVRNTNNAYRGTQASISEVEARKQAVISAESALEATQAGFEVGTRTIVDVLLTQRSLFQAQEAYSQARHGFILNKIGLKRAAGTLKRSDLEEISTHLKH
ncbi:MAG: TolC family outer membrane protein [bacterium]